MYSIVNSRVGPLGFEPGGARAAATRKLFTVVSAAHADGCCTSAALNAKHNITPIAKRFLFDMIFLGQAEIACHQMHYHQFREPIGSVRRITRSNAPPAV